MNRIFRIFYVLYLKWQNSIDFQVMMQTKENVRESGYDPFVSPERFRKICNDYDKREAKLGRR